MLLRSVRQFQVFILLSFFFLLFCPAAARIAFAQDTRQVTEPVVPPACATLDAQLTSHSGALDEADETKLDTARIQQAANRCPAGHAVILQPNDGRNAFLTAPLSLRSGVTLVVGAGATLFASRDPRLYDNQPGSCGLIDHRGRGCNALIQVESAPNAGVMGPGTIDGRGGLNLLGQSVSWWQLARQAQVENANQECPQLIRAIGSDNFTLYNITIINSPNFHVYYGRGNGFTAWGVIINTPATARNTDGIDPSSSTNVTITHCFIHAGDDNVAIKAGSDGPAMHMTIAHNHFYSGHGMSIGSETNGGASAIRVSDLTIDGADNGLRIKSNASRGGLVEDVEYSDVCIRDTKLPIFMDTHYTASVGPDTNRIPVFRGIVMRNVHIEGTGKITLDGFDAAHRLGLTFDGVTLDPAMNFPIEASHADITLGPGAVNFMPGGDDVHISGRAQDASSGSACKDRFIPMPK
ncbi:MAG: glycoside hydrolase family 28 protein [Candidatus Acidiferrales bacterium]